MPARTLVAAHRMLTLHALTSPLTSITAQDHTRGKFQGKSPKTVLSHHRKCEMKNPHLVDFSQGLVEFLVEFEPEFWPIVSRF